MYQPKDTIRSSIHASDFNETIIDKKSNGGKDGAQDEYLETEMGKGTARDYQGPLKTDRSKQTDLQSISPSDFLETDIRKGTETDGFALQTNT